MVAAVQMYAQSVMTLHARLPLPEDPAVPELAELTAQTDTAMRGLADVLRGRRPPTGDAVPARVPDGAASGARPGS